MGDSVQEQAPAELILQQAHPDHAYCLAPRLRTADKKEWSYNFSNQYPDTASMMVAAIEESSWNPDSAVFTISDEEGVLHGMWGYSVWSSPTCIIPIGAVWLCSDDELFDRFPKLMTQVARKEIFPALDQRFAAYGNLVHTENLTHIRWLARSGFRAYARTTRKGAPFTMMMRRAGGR